VTFLHEAVSLFNSRSLVCIREVSAAFEFLIHLT
jgi:hypothetical protein